MRYKILIDIVELPSRDDAPFQVSISPCSEEDERALSASFQTENQALIYFSSVNLLSHVQFFATPRTAARQASPSITNFWNLLKLMSILSVMPSNYLILCRPLLLLP